MTATPHPMPADERGRFDVLGAERFVSLTTFRRSGRPVSTPVWIARDGDALVVTTPTDSGKVKRLRNSDRVELRPCSRMGAIDDAIQPVQGSAALVSEEASVARSTDAIRAKYGFEYRLTLFIERMVARQQKPRVIVRILPAQHPAP